MAVYSNEDYLLELFVDYDLISLEQIDAYRGEVAIGHSVVDNLIQNGAVSEESVAKVCASASSMDFIDLASTAVPPNVFDSVPEDVAKRFNAVPIADDGTYLTVAIADPLDFEVLDTLPHILGKQINPVCATASAIKQAIESFYSTEEEDDTEVSGVSGGWGEESGDDAPIIKLVNDILVDAFKLGVSDIHVEPIEKVVRVRYRMDGKLTVASEHPKKLLPAIITRIKVMTSTMKISEKRIPQDGRIVKVIDGKQVDMRVSSLPTQHGESIVLRILDRSNVSMSLEELGLPKDVDEYVNYTIRKPNGIFVVTGPTGAGKTTTLYAALREINTIDAKLLTAEDPVEYDIDGIVQVPVNEQIDLDFPRILRAFLRQDPDRILVGEIRDKDTAQIAIQASLTGHLVLSTLHTNDAPGAVTRLVDMGAEPFLVAAS